MPFHLAPGTIAHGLLNGLMDFPIRHGPPSLRGMLADCYEYVLRPVPAYHSLIRHAQQRGVVPASARLWEASQGLRE